MRAIMNPTVPDARNEAREVLIGLSRGRFGRIAPELVAEQLLAATEDNDFRVLRASLEALARRFAFAVRDDLRIDKRPRGKSPLGAYTTRSPNGAKGQRPYTTELLALAPTRVSCSCADFVRSSLGLCKHALVLLHTLESEGALGKLDNSRSSHTSSARLCWNPVCQPRESADRLVRLSYVPPVSADGPRPAEAALATHFDRDGVPRAVQLRPGTRLQFIAELEHAFTDGSLTADAAAITVLREERERCERKDASRALVAKGLASLADLHRKLYPYQREGVKRLLEEGRLLLADDMGLGKTTQAIASCHALYRLRAMKKGLLIVPASLKPQWKREWESTTSVPLTLVDGTPEERARLYRETKSGFLILGYEQLLRDYAEIQRFEPELVVLDEAQRIKNWATKSAAYVKGLNSRFRLVLTGTPMENRFDELASIMDFVDDLALEPKWRLVPYHGISDGNGGSGMGGARNLDVLRERLATSMVRRVRKEVLAQLPPRTDTVVPVAFTDAQLVAHDDLGPPIAELAARGRKRPLTQPEFLRLMQMLTTQRMICNGLAQVNFDVEWPRCEKRAATTDMLASLQMPKLAVLRDLISEVVMAQGRKVVVFSQWRKMLRLSEWAIRDVLAAQGKRAAFFTGAESSKLRERAIVEFHDDPNVAVLFLSDAGGVGLNLQRAASCCINLELPWNPAVLEQRIGRIYRLGQSLPIDVYNLVTEEGIEGRIARLVAQKKAVFTTLFDGTTNEVTFDGNDSFLEGVRRLIGPVEAPPVASEDAALDPAVELQDEPAPLAEDAIEPTEKPSDVASTMNETAGTNAPSVDGIRVQRLADGGIRIDAPESLAGPLASLLEGLARSLRGT